MGEAGSTSGRIQMPNTYAFDVTPKNLGKVMILTEKGHKEAEMPSLLEEGEMLGLERLPALRNLRGWYELGPL